MTNISSIAPLSEFLKNEEAGWISLRPHKGDDNLVIANYTPSQTYRNVWDTVTLASRGLVFRRDTGEIVARPFKKFFNANQPGTEHIDTTGSVEVTNKEDGSMGISYLAPDSAYSIATRGSFHSKQAEHATEVFRAKYGDIWTPDEEHSFIFEIIYRGGRIVVDYGNMDDLILLGAVNKDTGVSVDRAVLESFGYPGPVTKIYDFPDYKSVFEAEQESNREGFVVRFNDSDERLKIKFDEYLSIHRLMFNLSPRMILEAIVDGLDIDEVLKEIPDEFTEEAKGWRDYFMSERAKYISIAMPIVEELKDYDRKERAALLLARNEEKVVNAIVFGKFTGWDDASVNATIWKFLDPRRHPEFWGNA